MKRQHRQDRFAINAHQKMPLRHGSLCSGYGGLDVAAQAVLGGRLAWWADIDPGAVAVMERHHPDVPNLGDIKGVQWEDVPRVDVVSAGYPCQPYSLAGMRRGVDDPRHLWPDIARAIGVLRPSIVILENVTGHVRRGFDAVVSDLATVGYDVAWSPVPASAIGAPHERQRLFVVAVLEGQGPVVADAQGVRRPEGQPEHAGQQGAPDAARDCCDGHQRWGRYAHAVNQWERLIGRPVPHPTVTGARGGEVLSPYLVEWAMGLPAGHVTNAPGLSRIQMLQVLGNGVVPGQAQHAIRGLLDRLALYRESPND